MLEPGMLISDRYEIIEHVGSGGMADVYKAKCQRLNRFVALKILKPEYSSDINFVNKFRGEAQSVAGLSHPNIVNVYDVVEDNDLYYIVMELVEGITLKRFIERKGKLEIREGIGIAIQIAQGMEAAHNKHIVHRDIKPQNIIISREGKVMVTDFGIAKATSSNTITSNTMGSVHYLSPEQARGGYSDEKSDIYSLGVTIYEMLSGRVPFSGDNNVSVALLHIQGETPSLKEINPNVPESIDKIVRKCMQKKPERRYLTASELIKDLKKSLTEPDGDFVHIPEVVFNDSPTINMEDDFDIIKKSNPRIDIEAQDSSNEPAFLEDDPEDDELDAIDSKVEKIFFIGSIAGIIIISIFIIFIVGWFFNFWGNGSKPHKDPDNDSEFGQSITPTETPTPTDPIIDDNNDDNDTFLVTSVVGLMVDDAINTLKNDAPELDIRTRENYSDVFPVGQVMEQYPQAPIEWNKTGQVQLTVSLGTEPFALPKVSDLTEEQADKKLEELGLTVLHEYPFDDEVSIGKAIKTKPETGEMVKKGDTITIYISNGPEITQVSVPSLLGDTETVAKNKLAAANLEIGIVSQEYSTSYGVGTVMVQSYQAGNKVAPGTKVDITISKGLEPVPVKYKYIGEVIININPFDYLESDDEVEVVLEMEQDGWVTDIFDDFVTSLDFPLKVKNIEGDSLSDGIVKMYVDNIEFKLPNSSKAKTWKVKFKAVEE